MRKLLKYFLIVTIVVIAMPAKNVAFEDLIRPFNIINATNTYYTTNAENIKSAKIINCGSAVFVTSNVENCKEIRTQLADIQGQSISFCGDEELYTSMVTWLIGNATFSANVGAVKCCYGYNNKLNNYINIENSKINIQIALHNNVITIGTPVILGSY